TLIPCPDPATDAAAPVQPSPPTVAGPDQDQPIEQTFASSVPEEPPRVQVPGYEILRELGRGGRGGGCPGWQRGLTRLVALNVVLHGGHAGAEEVGRFRAEAQAIARLQHLNIVQVFAVGTCEGLPFFAMEYCSGGSLAQRFATGPLSPQEAAALV